jgi:hypothetical protein
LVEIVIVKECPIEMYEDGVVAGRDAIRQYIAESGGQRPEKVTVSYDVEADDWRVELDIDKSPIVRTRRITGYLSNLQNFNTSKSYEERDRVKHFFMSQVGGE